MATSWQMGTSYQSRYSPFVMTTNSQYGNWFPDGGRGSIGRTTPAARRTLGSVSVSGDKRQALTPVDNQPVVNATGSDPRDKFTAFMAKSGTGHLAAMQNSAAAPLTVTESVQQTRRSAHTPGNSPEPGTVAEYQSGTIGSMTAQNRDNGSKPDTRNSRFSKPPGVVEVRPYVQQPTGSVTREARIPFSRSQTMVVATPVNGVSGEPNTVSREAAPRAMPTLERSQTFHGRPTTPYELVTMRKNDVIPDTYHWYCPQSDATPPTGTDTQTYVLASERGRHAGNNSAAAPAENRAMYWLYGSRGRPGPVVATDYLFSRDALDSQFGDRQSSQVPNGPNRQYDGKPTSGPLDSPSRTADVRQAAAAASSQSATVNSWTALRSPNVPYVSTVTVNTPRSADVGRVSRASGDATSRAVVSSKMDGAEKRSILKRTSGYDVGAYRSSGSVHHFGDPHLPPLSAASRTPSGRKRVTFNL